MPAGSVPPVTVKVYGAVPPLGCRSKWTGCPSGKSGRLSGRRVNVLQSSWAYETDARATASAKATKALSS